MPKILTLKGTTPKTDIIEFSLEIDGPEINIMANDSIIGWFEPTSGGKVKLVGAVLSQKERDKFVTNDKGTLAIE